MVMIVIIVIVITIMVMKFKSVAVKAVMRMMMEMMKQIIIIMTQPIINMFRNYCLQWILTQKKIYRYWLNHFNLNDLVLKIKMIVNYYVKKHNNW